MTIYDLDSLEDSCHKAMNEYARKESEKRKWIKWLHMEGVKVREEHNRRLKALKAEFNEKLEAIDA